MDLQQTAKPPTPKQLKNELALGMYAALLCSLIITIALLRQCSERCKRPYLTLEGRRKLLLTFYKSLDKRTSWAWAERPSRGLVALVCVYILSNGILSSNMLALCQLNHYASRFGWLAAANMALCTFLAVKNTPLDYFRCTTHTMLNKLHRVVGYTAVLLVILHATLYTAHFARKDNWLELLKFENILGIGAGFLMFVLLMGINRHQGYEVFVASHILGFVGAVLLTALHRPNWAKKLPLVMSIIGSMWILDRLTRGTRFLRGMINNHAMIYPLPHGATRVVLRKAPSSKGLLTGSHYYIWLPGISILQAHTFTAINHSQLGLEFVVKAERGLTRTLYELAQKRPGLSLRASADGPYGQPPDIQNYNQVVIIAGGSGGAFALGYLNHILGLSRNSQLPPIHFFLALKNFDQVSWFQQQLLQKSKNSAINLIVYITRPAPIPLDSSHSQIAEEPRFHVESRDVEASTSLLLASNESSAYHSIQSVESGRSELSNVDFRVGKMDVASVLQQQIPASNNCSRVSIVGCGPKSLLDAIKDWVDAQPNDVGLHLDTHFEDFDS